MTELLSFDSTNRQFGWDATSISSFEKCPRYYKYKHLEGWQQSNKSVHLLFGGWYAEALEHHAKHLCAGMDADEALCAVVREILIATWEYEYAFPPEADEGTEGMARARGGKVPIPGTGEPWDSLHNTKTRETLIRSIVWYFDHFEDDPAETVILTDGTPAVEYSFSIPLDDEIMYCGHIDKLVSYGGDYYVMDQKTAGTTITQRYFEGFTPDIQMSGYTFGGKILFDLPVKGVIIDAVQIAVGFSQYSRGFIHRTDAQLDDWMDSSLETIKLARQRTEDNHFPMNRTACGNYGGCEFRAVCSASPTHRKRLFAADFHQAPRWDPLKER